MDATYRGVVLRYGIDRAKLPAALARAVVPMDADPETRAWVDDAMENPVPALAMHARKLAAKVMSDYDANGMLGTHDMRVLGTEQWRRLFGGAPGGTLLDVGAGDGHVTDTLAPLFESVATTETSPQMAKRLRKRGYPCHEVDLVENPLEGTEPFDVVTLLNVLDRTHRPLSLLEAIAGLLREGGALVAAVPFPLSPHVHVGPVTVDADEPLPIDRSSWEAQATALAELVFAPNGFVVEGLSRVPYLCRSAKQRPVLTLDDAIFLCRKRGTSVLL